MGEVDARTFLVLDASKVSIQNLRICLSMSVEPPAIDVYPDKRIPYAHAWGNGDSRCLRHATNIVRRPHRTMGSRIVVHTSDILMESFEFRLVIRTGVTSGATCARRPH